MDLFISKMITDIILFALYTYFWNSLYKIFYSYYKDIEVSRNLRNLINVLLFILGHNVLGEEYYIQLAIFACASYLYDTYILLYNATSIADYFSMYVLYNRICMIALYYVYIDYAKIFIMEQFYILDISNALLYLAYHYNKNKILLLLGFITYSYYRIYVHGTFIINNLDEFMGLEWYDNIMLSIIYIYGVISSYKLYVECKKEITT
jgi:hypothetical protein